MDNPDIAPALAQFSSSKVQDVLRPDRLYDILTRLRKGTSAESKHVLLAVFADDIALLFFYNRVPWLIALFQKLSSDPRIECQFQPRFCASRSNPARN
jgi:hypothetical protein